MAAKRGRKPANEKAETTEAPETEVTEKVDKTAPVAKSAKPKAAMQVAKDDCVLHLRKDIRRCEGELIHAMKKHRLDNESIQLDNGVDCAIWIICDVAIPHDLRGEFEALLPGNLVQPTRGIFYVDPGMIDG